MNIFKKAINSMKTNLTSTIVRTVVSSKIDKLEKQMKESNDPINNVLDAVFGIYGTASKKIVRGVSEFITDNKDTIVSIVSENYDTLVEIKSRVESLNNPRNRELMIILTKSIIKLAKNVDAEMDTIIDTVRPSEDINTLKDIWK